MAKDAPMSLRSILPDGQAFDPGGVVVPGAEGVIEPLTPDPSPAGRGELEQKEKGR
jgi:hypothetical protein